MLELFVVGQPVICTTGTCPQTAAIVATAPAVVSVPLAVQSPIKTTVQYKRGLLGRLQPVGATTVYEPVEVEVKSAKKSQAKAQAQSCKSCGK